MVGFVKMGKKYNKNIQSLQNQCDERNSATDYFFVDTWTFGLLDT